MKDLYNRYKNSLQRKNSLEVRQYKLEQHLRDNPTDYKAVIANELVKSDIAREDMKLTEIRKKLSIYEIV